MARKRFPSSLTLFQLKVLRAVEMIPRGTVKSYKEVAEAVGSPNSYRAVGSALKKNPFPVSVPCHRVVKADGSIGGYSGAGGAKRKKELLRMEGVTSIRGRLLR